MSLLQGFNFWIKLSICEPINALAWAINFKFTKFETIKLVETPITKRMGEDWDE